MSAFPADLRSPSPPAKVRALLLAEVVIFIGLAAACLWLTPRRHASREWYHTALWVFAGVLPVAANLLHGDRPRDSGIRVDNFFTSAKEVGAVTLVLALALVVTGLIFNGFDHPTDPRRVFRMGLRLIGGGLIQQYALQAFVLRRLRQAGLGPVPAVVVAVGLFAGIHWPNWVLVGLTVGGGTAWCAMFLRRPNLITLGISHGLLALLAYNALPRAWHWGLAVGPRFLERAARYAP